MDYTDIPIEENLTGGEGEMLLFALDRVHRQFAWKSGGLTAAQLGQRHPPSGMTIAGTLVHLAKVEEHWTALAAEREPRDVGPEPVNAYDAEWREAEHVDPAELYRIWYDTVSACRQEWTALVRDDGLDVVLSSDPGWVVNRRRRLVDILEENLLHTGQTSIIREAIDGLTGNDPP